MMLDNTSSSLKYSKDIKAVEIGVRDLQERILTETYGIKNQIVIQTQGINENFNIKQANLILIYSKQEMAQQEANSNAENILQHAKMGFTETQNQQMQQFELVKQDIAIVKFEFGKDKKRQDMINDLIQRNNITLYAIAGKVEKQEENFQDFQSTLNNLDTSLKANTQSFQAQFDLFENEINKVANGWPF
jgi:Txe/YoeB family toxin of Txe-Axe toxin-antitoxin module